MPTPALILCIALGKAHQKKVRMPITFGLLHGSALHAHLNGTCVNDVTPVFSVGV